VAAEKQLEELSADQPDVLRRADRPVGVWFRRLEQPEFVMPRQFKREIVDQWWGKPNTTGTTHETAIMVDHQQRGACPVDRDQLVGARDPLQLLIQWMEWRYATHPVPSRDKMLNDVRDDFGKIRYVLNRKAIARLREATLPEHAKRGGARTHRHKSGQQK